MLTLKEMQDRLNEMTYLPQYEMKIYQGRFEGAHFHLTANVPDYIDKGKFTILDIHSSLPAMESISQLDNWVVDRLIRIASHEVREALQIGGKPIFNPHAEGADKDL